ncbi:unnamed protein product [Effrenium voratum]|nr:unnamed protein product [Effrenium voratum]
MRRVGLLWRCRKLQRGLASGRGLGQAFLSPGSACAAIDSLGRSHDWQGALEFLTSMPRSLGLGQAGHEYVPCFNAAASACERSSQWELSLLVLGSVTATTVTRNITIAAWARGSHWMRSLASLRATPEKDIVSFNVSLRALERSSKWQHSLALFQEMTENDSPGWDARSVGAVIAACAKGGDWQRGLQLLQLCPGDLHCHTALLSAFRRSGAWQQGLQHLRRLRHLQLSLDPVAFDTALSLCEAEGAWQHAWDLLDDMRQQSLQPSVAGLCSAAKALRGRRDVLGEIEGRVFALLEADSQTTAWGVHLVRALDALHEAGRLSDSVSAAFQPVLDRTVAALRQAAQGNASGHRGHAIQSLGLHGLGPFTERALKELGLAGREGPEAEMEWVPTARAAVASALSVPSRASARNLLSWFAYAVDPKMPGLEGPEVDECESKSRSILLWSTGEIVAHGLSQPVWPHALQPIFSRHDRSQHSERRALLTVLRRLHCGGAGKHATGSVRLFTCHTPCISCLFVFVQFQAMFPQIRLSVAFDSWTETKASLGSAQQKCIRGQGQPN